MDTHLLEKLVNKIVAMERRISELERGESPSGVDPAGHLHAKLVASDGDPDPALSADATGAVTAAIAPFTLTGGQLAFPAAGNPSADANTLDDYEEGDWTMSIAFGGASVGVTYNIQAGYYTKIGNVVTVSGYLILTDKGSSVGIASVTGLPFTVVNASAAVAACAVHLRTITFANQYEATINQNSTIISLQEIIEAGNTSDLTNNDFADTSRVMVNATYRAA